MNPAKATARIRNGKRRLARVTGDYIQPGNERQRKARLVLQAEAHIPSQVMIAIGRIGNDTRSGAAEILGAAAEIFSLLLTAQETTTDIHVARRAVLAVCAALVEAQPDMAPLLNLASDVIEATTRATRTDEIFITATAAARDFIHRAKRAAQATIAHALALIGDGATVLTHSRSSTVLAALREAHSAGRRLHVIATESRPLFEGRALAEALAREGVRVTLIADAAAALGVERADFVLFGADRVTPDVLVNKIGTRMIAMAARAHGVAVHAACDTSKFIAALPDALSEKPRSSDELWPDAPPGIAVLNRYFEPTPLASFTTIITEDGALRPEATRQRAAANSIDTALLAALDKSP